jgi:hypothetical protein
MKLRFVNEEDERLAKGLVSPSIGMCFDNCKHERSLHAVPFVLCKVSGWATRLE